MIGDGVSPQPNVANSYAVLGVTAGAPLTLVERIYWQRAHALTEAARRGEPNARERLDELNTAQALLRETPVGAAAASTGVPVRAARRGAAVAVLVCSLAGAGVASVAFDVIAGAGVFACGAVATLVLGMRGAAPDAPSPGESQRDALAMLYLAPGAAADEIKIAYETLRDSTLAGGSDRDAAVLDRLERLQSAYQSALPSGGVAYRRS
jgi:hypothetical protein